METVIVAVNYAAPTLRRGGSAGFEARLITILQFTDDVKLFKAILEIIRLLLLLIRQKGIFHYHANSIH